MRQVVSRKFVAAVLGGAGVWCAPAAGGVVVLQVEAREAGGAFSPVDFGGSVVRVGGDGGAFPGIRFAAASRTSASVDDRGGHAAMVGGQIYGAGSPGMPFVQDVVVMTTDDLFSAVLRPRNRRTGAVLAPTRLPGNAKVLNASFAGSTGSAGVDGDLLRRADLVAARDGVFVAAGAVSATSGTFGGAGLIWGGRNVVAVRGASAESVFEPETNAVGRTYPNLWGAGTASGATGAVSSMGAALIGRAGQRNVTLRPAVVRAVLMAGADRGAEFAGGELWSADLANGLDSGLGAGRADLAGAEAIVDAGAVGFAAVSKGAVKGPFGGTKGRIKTIAEEVAGWGSATVRPGQTAASLFRLGAGASGVTADLTWDTVVKSGGKSVAVGDLRLELRTVTITGKGDAVLGAAVGSVDADGDNVRHLVLEGALEAGVYAWTVRNEGRETLVPGLAFRFEGPGPEIGTQGLPGTGVVGVVPEPGFGLFGVVGGVVLGRRRRR